MFIPSPNIGVHQLAYYQCSVDHHNSIIVWHINGTVSTNINITQLGITTSGAGTPTSSLIIPGYPQYNNTVVTCIAYGPVEGNSNATLRIQGTCKDSLMLKNIDDEEPYVITELLQSLFSLSHIHTHTDKLSEVGGLICTRQGHCCIKCSWSPPFSLDGVSIYGYIINVTNEGDNTQYTTTSNTTSWIYCPSQFGNYTISIAGNNSAGEGEISTTSVTLPTGIISSIQFLLYGIHSNHFWIFCDS